MSELSKLRDSKRDNARRPARSTLEQIRDAVVSGVGGYLDRQGRYANEGLALADQGAGELRNANPWGALNMPLGALGYLTSPINALLPSGDEIDATNMSPEARRLLTAGTAGMMAVMPGGPKGKGLGRGMASLADDATDAERAALKTRLDEEVQQVMDIPPRQYTPEEIANLKARLAASRTPEDDAIAAAKRQVPPIEEFLPRSRDQALRNLTEAPTDAWLKLTPMEMRAEGLSILNKIRPLEAALKKALQSGDASQVEHIRAKLKPLQERYAPLRDYVRPGE